MKTETLRQLQAELLAVPTDQLPDRLAAAVTWREREAIRAEMRDRERWQHPMDLAPEAVGLLARLRQRVAGGAR